MIAGRLRLVAILPLMVLLVAACAPAAPPAPPEPAASPPAEPAPPEPAEKPAEPPESKPAEEPALEPVDPGVLSDAERAEVEDFYQGETVRIIVGFGAGGGYDTFARATARHLGRHIPGNPSVIVENMPGAGSLTAANHVYNAAPKDGTVIGTFSPGLVLEYAMRGQPDTFQFDPAQYPWLGSPTLSTNQCMLATETGINTLEELVETDQGITFGSSAPSSVSTSGAPRLISHYLNPNVRVVYGYDGVTAIKLAVERGEVDASCGTWQTFRATHADWLEGEPPLANVVLKSSDDPEGQLDEVPALTDFLPEGEAQEIYGVTTAPDEAGFAYAAPLDVPEVRFKALQIALMETWNDAEFMAEAEQANLAVIPQDGERVSELFNRIVSTSPEMLERAGEVLGLE